MFVLKFSTRKVSDACVQETVLHTHSTHGPAGGLARVSQRLKEKLPLGKE